MVYFIAEVSSNHARNLGRCLQFVDTAAEIGCDAVKFQLFRVNELFSPEILAKSPKHRAREAWELPKNFLEPIAERCRVRKIEFVCTPFFLEAVELLRPYVDRYKVASYELLWHELIRACTATGKPLLLSTGMATLDEIAAAVQAARDGGGGSADLTLLHCVSGYPTPAIEANLAALETMGRTFGTPMGWSDHTVRPAVIQRAVHRWRAVAVEFHLDLDGSGDEFVTGHCWLPEAAGAMIAGIREGLGADGTGEKVPMPAERPDRDWRADPADGLRPMRSMRPGWEPIETPVDGFALSMLSEALAAAVAYHQAGCLNDAECLYRQILIVAPDNIMVLNNLGVILTAQGRHREALPSFERAHALRPDCGETRKNLFAANRHEGLRLFLSGDYLAAVPRFEHALNIEGDHSSLLIALGLALQKLRRLAEAAGRYEQALSLRPDFAEALLNLGTALQEQGRLTEAVRRYEQAARVDPQLGGPDSNMGCALRDLGRFEDGLACLDRALAFQPESVDIIQSRLFSLNYLDHLSASAVAAEHVCGGAILMAGNAAPALPRRERRERLCIGYVSPDFRRHPVSSFFEPLLSAHDRAEFEIVCYAEVPNPDAVTTRLRGAADRWRNTVGLSDAVLAATIRADGVDILVDLAGHSRGNRLPAFALRPAPVQVNWLGYPSSTGFPAIDYRLVDAITDPPGEADTLATERLIRLDGGFLCFKPPEDAPPPEAPPCLRAGAITFGSFNNPSKISPSTVETWAALLRRLPDSRLLLKGLQLTDPTARQVLRSRFAEHGIAAERLDMMGFLPDDGGHLGVYHRVDIALDPFPYNGTTTTCETLWMGVPVVTLLGDRHAGRIGASLLGRVGLESLIARDRNEYVALAVDLAGEPERLATLRADIRQRMAVSALCDAAAFARKIEATYRKLWDSDQC